MLIMDALNLNQRDIVVAVGGGGKTTILKQLGRELSGTGNKAIISTTTKIMPPKDQELTDLVLTEYYNDIEQAVERSLDSHKLVYVGKCINKENKLLGLTEQEVVALFEFKTLDFLLIEGDGSRGRPFKAPRFHEPVIPGIANVIIIVIGIDCLGKPLSEKYFHSVDQIKLLTGLNQGVNINEDTIVKIMLHPQGYKKNVPLHAKWIPFINKVDNKKDELKAMKIASLLKSAGVEKIIIGNAINKNCPVRFIW